MRAPQALLAPSRKAGEAAHFPPQWQAFLVIGRICQDQVDRAVGQIPEYESEVAIQNFDVLTLGRFHGRLLDGALSGQIGAVFAQSLMYRPFARPDFGAYFVFKTSFACLTNVGETPTI